VRGEIESWDEPKHFEDYTGLFTTELEAEFFHVQYLGVIETLNSQNLALAEGRRVFVGALPYQTLRGSVYYAVFCILHAAEA